MFHQIKGCRIEIMRRDFMLFTWNGRINNRGKLFCTLQNVSVMNYYEFGTDIYVQKLLIIDEKELSLSPYGICYWNMLIMYNCHTDIIWHLFFLQFYPVLFFDLSFCIVYWVSFLLCILIHISVSSSICITYFEKV